MEKDAPDPFDGRGMYLAFGVADCSVYFLGTVSPIRLVSKIKTGTPKMDRIE
jgi:hypothetical protein